MLKKGLWSKVLSSVGLGKKTEKVKNQKIVKKEKPEINEPAEQTTDELFLL